MNPGDKPPVNDSEISESELHLEVEALRNDAVLTLPQELSNPLIADQISVLALPPDSEKYYFSQETLLDFLINDCKDTETARLVKDSIDEILKYINNRPYLVFKPKTSPQEIEKLRELFTQAGGEYYFEESKLRINNITVLLISLENLLGQLRIIFGTQVIDNILQKLRMSNFISFAKKKTQEYWKKESTGKLSASPEYAMLPWDKIYEVYYELIKLFTQDANSGTTSTKKVILDNKEFILDEEIISEIFELVDKDTSSSAFNIDHKLHFLRDEIVGVIPNIRRFLSCVETLFQMKLDGVLDFSNVENILDEAMQKISTNQEK